MFMSGHIYEAGFVELAEGYNLYIKLYISALELGVKVELVYFVTRPGSRQTLFLYRW